MKKIILVICLIMGFASAVYAGKFCCALGKTKEECCAERGKIYCPNDNSCRTRCLGVTPPDCIGGCINPNGGCCTWCPSAEVCAKMNKCQKIGADGCYECVECDEACPSPKCLNQEGKCCDSCPRVCPAGQCLVNVNGCYQCGPCKGPTPPTPDDDDDVDDDDDDTETTEPNLCEGKDKHKDCKECDPSTGDYTIGGCGEGQVCCAGNCVSNQCDMMKCETFVGDLTDLGGSAVCKCVSNCSENEYCYTGDAASLGGSIRCCPNLEPIDEENCLTETCLYDDGGTSTLHGCPYRCSKCEAEETCSNGHCCAKGEVYIEAAQICCPSARNCGHFCCGEGEYCASMDTVCCKTGQVLCNGEC